MTFFDLSGKLSSLAETYSEISSEYDVAIGELLSDDFLQKHTPYQTLDELITSGGFCFDSEEAFEAIDCDALNQHIATTTSFSNWQELLSKAKTEYFGDVEVEEKLALRF